MTSLRRPSLQLRFAATVAVLALGSLSCAAPARLYVNPQADMTLYQKLAVVPFVNLSGDPYAAARITRAFTTELVMTDRFKLTDPSQIMGELERSGGLPDAQGQIDLTKLREAATRLDATGLIRGAVTEYGTRHAGVDDFPVVAFDAELVDAATGNIVWRISVVESGKGRIPVVGGPSERSFGRVTEEACRHAVEQLRGKAF